MNIKRITYCFILLTSLLLMSSSSTKGTASITVKITNIESTDGVIEIGLYNNVKKFSKVGETHRMIRIKPKGKVITYKFKYLTSGNYAFCIFHDQNDDGKCNKNLLGIPTEPYAFSNNFRPWFSKPKFSDCSFSVKDAKEISIKMVN